MSSDYQRFKIAGSTDEENKKYQAGIICAETKFHAD